MTEVKPASPKQLKWLCDLLKKHDTSGWPEEWAATADRLRDAFDEIGAHDYPPEELNQELAGKGGVPLSMEDFHRLLPKLQDSPIVRKDKAVAKSKNPPTEDGIYATVSKGRGEDHSDWVRYYKVYWNNERNRLLAKEIVLTDEAEPPSEQWPDGKPAISELVYRGMAERFVTADDKYQPTLEEALAFGPTYGRCGICGRELNDEVSVKLGIGPVCGGREFGDNFKTMHKIAKAELEAK